MKDNNNNFDLTAAFDNIGFDFTGRKTKEATIEALKAIQAEQDSNRKWSMIRDLAIALSCSIATIVAWLWPNKKAIHKEIRKYDAGEFLWKDEFYTSNQMMNMGIYPEYANKCKEVADTVKAIEKAKNDKAEEEEINSLKETLKRLKEERDNIRRNPDFKKDDKKKGNKKKNKNENKSKKKSDGEDDE